DQSGGVHRLRTGVVVHVRRLTGDEARLQLGLDVHGGADVHRDALVQGLHRRAGVLRVLIAVAAVEDDDVHGPGRVDAEGVVVGDLAAALGDRAATVIAAIVAAPAGGAGTERDRTGAEAREGQEVPARGRKPVQGCHVVWGSAHRGTSFVVERTPAATL